MTLLFFLSPLVGCLATMDASLSSSVIDDEGAPVESATVTIYDINEELFSSTTTDSNGAFSVSLPPHQTFFAVLEHESHLPTSHTGFAGEGQTEAEEKLMIQNEEAFRIRQAQYSDCGDSFGFIEGEVRVAIPDQDVEDMPIVTTARAIAYNLDYVGTTACYIDPSAEIPQTGDSGRYLIANLSEGLHEVLLTIQYDPQTQKEFYYLVYVPQNGIAPLLPNLIPL